MRKKTELSIEEVSKILHKEAQSLRIGLRQKRFEWGDAFQRENGRWSYVIYPTMFYRKLGFEKGIENKEEREKIKKKLLAS